MSAQRGAFEAHAISQSLPIEPWVFVPHEYHDDKTQEAWIAWQAAQAEMQAELVQLRGFAVDVMGAWPGADLDGGDLQDIAERHGLLIAQTLHQPCSASCGCKDYVSDEQFAAGVNCYRKAPFLMTGSAA